MYVCRQDDYDRRTVSDEDVRASAGHHVHVAHTDLRVHGVLLLHEEMDEPEEDDGIGGPTIILVGKIKLFFI